MLPAPREPLWLRSGEQNLHIPAGTFRSSGRSAVSPLCSPLPASPCSSVSGSKIFTFPPPDFVLLAVRRPPLFAPRSPLTLVTSFRGAKSSHSRRRISTSQALGGSFSLLPAPRKPLQLRFGEQNFHIPVARFLPHGRPAAPSLCSPLPASPCGSVSRSKIFTFPSALSAFPKGRRISPSRAAGIVSTSSSQSVKSGLLATAHKNIRFAGLVGQLVVHGAAARSIDFVIFLIKFPRNSVAFPTHFVL